MFLTTEAVVADLPEPAGGGMPEWAVWVEWAA